MIKSMTGYGKGEFVGNNRKYIVEIKSVNHKYLDFNFKMPKALSIFEDNIRKILSKNITRGKIDVNIRFENFSDIGKNIKIDDELLNQYLSEFDRISKKYNIKNDITLSNIIELDNILKLEQDEEENDVILNELTKAIDLAIENYIEMKKVEGKKIAENMEEKLITLEENINKIEKLSEKVVDEYKERIETRLKEYISEHDIDYTRILTEIVIFADKMTIDEEIIRFKSHINQFRKELNSDNSVGKKLDFIIQEMNRETNTIGSKTNCLEITNLVILNKAINENIREQIQNIE
ncbi:MAG: YicC family protein [Clostridiales bacterium]|nr:YicC family protein [Clostridiales bacterium]